MSGVHRKSQGWVWKQSKNITGSMKQMKEGSPEGFLRGGGSTHQHQQAKRG